MTVLTLHYVYLATEAHDDDGLPHTLEHLVFMGSENYPYKVLQRHFDNYCPNQVVICQPANIASPLVTSLLPLRSPVTIIPQ